MKYIIEIHENREPGVTRFSATVEGLDNCVLEEPTLDDMYKNAPEVVKAVIETSNECGSTFPLPTAFEFRLLISA